MTDAELAKVKADADALGLSVQNYQRKCLGLELREAGGIRAGGFEPGNAHAAKRKTRRLGASAGASID